MLSIRKQASTDKTPSNTVEIDPHIKRKRYEGRFDDPDFTSALYWIGNRVWGQEGGESPRYVKAAGAIALAALVTVAGIAGHATRPDASVSTQLEPGIEHSVSVSEQPVDLADRN